VPAPGLLGNDSDIDGDTLTAVLVSNVSHGTLTLNANGFFAYTAESGFVGTDSFTYKANDGIGDSATVTVTIEVTLPEPPTIASLSKTVVITGTNLDGFTDLDFGAGIRVISILAHSSTQMTAEIRIDSDTALGARDVTVTTPEGTFALENGFTVEKAKSGGAPVWIWPLVAVALIGAVAGGFFFFFLPRRKDKRS
jgi:VCBS repeat-containing protein